jgi:hypothetical protein
MQRVSTNHSPGALSGCRSERRGKIPPIWASTRQSYAQNYGVSSRAEVRPKGAPLENTHRLQYAALSPFAGLMRTLCPECRAAVAMVTGQQQPDPRVGRPGRESNPVLVVSQGTADVQSQGALEERSSSMRRRLIFLESVRGRQSSCKGPFGPLLRACC